MTDLPWVTLLLLAPISYASFKVGQVCDVVLTGGSAAAVAKGLLVTMARFFDASVDELEQKRKERKASAKRPVLQ